MVTMKAKLISDHVPKRRNDIVVIAGDGRSLPNDIERIKSMDINHDIYPIGRSVKLFDTIDHWGTVDGSESIWWAENLNVKWHNGLHRHTMGEMRGFDFDWEIEQSGYGHEDILWHGSTALFAAITSIAMGYAKVILAGCPMDSSGHWYFVPEITGPKWTAECFMAWLDFKTQPESNRVKSMSGYTAIILGTPEDTWLYDL